MVEVFFRLGQGFAGDFVAVEVPVPEAPEGAALTVEHNVYLELGVALSVSVVDDQTQEPVAGAVVSLADDPLTILTINADDATTSVTSVEYQIDSGAWI